MVSSKAAQKVEPLADHAAMGFSGSVSGADYLTRTLRAELSLYETRRNTRMSPTAVASLVTNTLRENPVGVMPVVGVVGDAGHLYSYDGAGGMTEEPYAAVGSGMPYAFGYLESRYEPCLSVDDATTLAAEAVAVASERDTASGNGLNLAVVTADGVERESRETLTVAG
jgi:proteasome beta subunit